MLGRKKKKVERIEYKEDDLEDEEVEEESEEEEDYEEPYEEPEEEIKPRKKASAPKKQIKKESSQLSDAEIFAMAIYNIERGFQLLKLLETRY